MNGVDCFRLGRRLMKLGLESFPPSGFKELPTSHRMVLTDVVEHPDSSISEITARTGFPQSHVSMAVARLREGGAVVTTPDPHDRRRTLVRRSPQHEAAARQVVAPIEPVLARALASSRDGSVVDGDVVEDEELTAVLSALELLTQRFVHAPSDAAGRGRGTATLVAGAC